MASVKIGTLVIRTVAKPISAMLKTQAKQHEGFRDLCIGLAQRMHRSEMRLRYSLLGQEPKAVRPLNERTAVENGANAIAEGFLFGVAALLILAESYRSSRKDSKRRNAVDDQFDDMQLSLDEVRKTLKDVQEQLQVQQERSEQVARILKTLIDSGLNQRLGEMLSSADGVRVAARVPALDASSLAELHPPTAPSDLQPSAADSIEGRQRGE
ncbi:OPA3-domain-containing protein [Auriculariales sp. MPI-PUGE-AT-0066]|nr:OPA3-domain-containing protein [Auriculariales sp. MPI-PUGE-AT-0066]